MCFRNLAPLGLFVVCAATFGQDKTEVLPEAPGRKVLQKVCSSCHEIESVIVPRRTRAGWQQSVDDMIARGADGSNADVAAIVEYLVTYFGTVNVNTASTAELEKALGLSNREAQAIVAYRERQGKIKNFDDLKKVPDISAEKLQAKRGLIAFSQ